MYLDHYIYLEAGYIDPMLAQCRATVYDGGPTLNQHWVNVSRLLRMDLINENNG